MKRYKLICLATLSGAILSLAWTVWCFGLALFIGFVPLLFIENYFDRNKHEYRSFNVFIYSYLSFFIWNGISTWWIIKATLVGMASAVIFNSLFMATVYWLYHIVKRMFGSKSGICFFVFLWLSFEYLHLNWELSWPWLNLGNGFAKDNVLIQWYEYTGILGGSLWILICNILIFFIINDIFIKKSFSGIRNKLIVLSFLIFCPILISLFIYYSYKEKLNPRQLLVIQPNIDPYNEKFSGMTNEEQLDILLALANQNTDSSTDFIIGPETAIPTVLWENDIPFSNSYKVLQKFLSAHSRIRFILGLSSGKVYRDGELRSETARKFRNTNMYYDLYNTAMQVDTGRNIQLYHKSKLVLGVEKMPFPKVLGFLEKYAADLGGTTGSLGIQDEPTVFKSVNDNIKVGVMICYESIYGEYVTGYVKKGAGFLFVITNDGWWGDTPGYKQHLHFSQLRAVETRRSVARSANTGISCFIDQRGDLIQPTKWWTRTAIKNNLNANNKITFYTRFGDFIGKLSVIIIGLFLVYSIILKYSKKNLLIL